MSNQVAPAQRIVCPVCEVPWRSQSRICASCGANLDDPDVQAFAGSPAAAAAAGETGTLGMGKLFGVDLERLRDGTAMRRLGLWGGLLLAVAFVMPAHRLWKWVAPPHWGDERRLETTLKFSWDLFGDGNSVALLYPLVAALLGFAVAWVPGLPTHVRAKLLAATGLVGLVVCVAPLGEYGSAPTQVATLTALGLIVGGTAVAARVLEPRSIAARDGLVAAAVLFTLGMLIPTSHLAERLYLEFKWRGLDETSVIPLLAIVGKGLALSAGSVFLVALWLVLPLVLLPVAAVLAWKQPGGVWDKDGMALRPVAWALVLYLPVLYGLMAFSALGWDDQRAHGALLGRMRLSAITLPLWLWAQFGLLAALPARRTTGGLPVATADQRRATREDPTATRVI
jgi:hypothetical protein